MSGMFCCACEDNQATAYIKYVDNFLILIVKNAIANEFQYLSNKPKYNSLRNKCLAFDIYILYIYMYIEIFVHNI